MQSITIQRTGGNIPRSLPGEDHISGLLFYNTALPDGFDAQNRIKACSTLDTAEELGITADNDDWGIRVLHYQLSEIFRINPGILLYVGIYPAPQDANLFYEILLMQSFASGRLRQIAVWDGSTELSADSITQLQGRRTRLEMLNTPLSILYAPKISDITNIEIELYGANKNGVSVLIGQAGSGLGAKLFADAQNTQHNSVTGIGVLLGIVSLAAVNESIAWVEKFPTGINEPAFSDGSLLRSFDSAVEYEIDAARYIFFKTYSGLSGSYINDSNTMDLATSDYAYIENVRTMDKAVRGIYTYLLPKLGQPLTIDAATGRLKAYTVETLQLVAGKALEDMEKAGEISGYVVEIDPDQNVLSTSEVVVVIRKIDTGVMRQIKVKIGNTTNINS